MTTYRDLPFAQLVRVLDVIVIGPMMVQAGKKSRMPWLTFFGWTTIGYNAINFVRRLSTGKGIPK